jgi:hypothetical protein
MAALFPNAWEQQPSLLPEQLLVALVKIAVGQAATDINHALQPHD